MSTVKTCETTSPSSAIQSLPTEEGSRFSFGKNWRQFLSVVNEQHIEVACDSIRESVGIESLAGKSFLDAGCGSGLFSLCAARLQANQIHSFDFDADSVDCTQTLKQRFFPNEHTWRIEQASCLDEEYLTELGQFDVVYSWGVLHHTGDMWTACNLIAPLVKPGGRLIVSIYNRQPWSGRWRAIKKTYSGSRWGRTAIVTTVLPAYTGACFLIDLVRLKNPLDRFLRYHKKRGMSWRSDMHDWLGGYPFEVAKPEDVFHYFRDRGFVLERLKTAGLGHGCNEFVFTKRNEPV